MDELREGIREDKTTAMPVTPPVEKWLGNLKKYTPTATSAVPSVRSRNSRTTDFFCIRKDLLSGEGETAARLFIENISDGCRHCSRKHRSEQENMCKKSNGNRPLFLVQW